VTLGHRYLKNYYKQHLPSYEQRKVNAVGRVMVKYRALGWKGSSYGGLQGKRDKGWALKMRQQKEMQLGVKANKLQRHFRPQVIF
jgi:pre-60S factor REI1